MLIAVEARQESVGVRLHTCVLHSSPVALVIRYTNTGLLDQQERPERCNYGPHIDTRSIVKFSHAHSSVLGAVTT